MPQMQSINKESMKTTATNRITLSNAFAQKSSVVKSNNGWVSFDVLPLADNGPRDDPSVPLVDAPRVDDGGCSAFSASDSLSGVLLLTQPHMHQR